MRPEYINTFRSVEHLDAAIRQSVTRALIALLLNKIKFHCSIRPLGMCIPLDELTTVKPTMDYRLERARPAKVAGPPAKV